MKKESGEIKDSWPGCNRLLWVGCGKRRRRNPSSVAVKEGFFEGWWVDCGLYPLPR